MAEEVILPSLGQTTNELTIIEWFKKDGDIVKKGDVLLEVETDKAVVPVEAYVEGILKDIRHFEGDLVEVGSVLALIMTVEEASGSEKAIAVQQGAGQDAGQNVDQKTDQNADSISGHDSGKSSAPIILSYMSKAASSPMSEAAGDYILSSPLAKQMAREQAIDLREVQGSGRDGVIKANDVADYVQNRQGQKNQQNVLNQSQTSKPFAPTSDSNGSAIGTGAKTKLSKMRKTIAERLTLSKQTIPHFYLTVHIDVSDLVRLREDLKQQNVDVSYNSFLFRASALALFKFPTINSSLIDDCIVTHPEVHIGLAVEVEDGLRVPVIRSVGQKMVWELTGILKETAERVKEGRLSAAESSGGTFTISSLGGFGIDEFSAIINPPEAAILAVGRISKRVFVYGDEVKSGMGLSLTLSVDHRVVDGAMAGRFLNEIRELLEHPHRLLVPSNLNLS
ncbi:MAG TPA: dihydrolipoamide acetyltransferase family protein [Bacilli bacterium]